MPTNRELFFSLLKENNKYLKRLVIKSLLNDANNFCDEITLYKHFDEECLNYEELLKKIERVRNGEPFQYVLGFANFIDWDFKVNSNVLIPRQETEQLVINTKRIIEQGFHKDHIVIADVCTGSGCIGVSLKKYFPNSTVYATDIDENALGVAKENAKFHHMDVKFLQGDMLEPLIKEGVKVDLLISNPPYIGSPDSIDEQVFKYEPHKALLATPNTLYYESIFKNIDKVLNKDGIIALEIGEDMVDSLDELLCKYMPNTNYYFIKDMYGKMRFLYIIEPEDSTNA